MEIERRSTACQPRVQTVRGAGGQFRKVIVGHAAVFEREAQFWNFREKIAPGAFARAIEQRQDVRALFNHDPNLILGRTGAGTLRLQEDNAGLLYEVDLPDTGLGRDLLQSIRRSDVSQSSFAFIVVGERWTDEKGRLPLRIIEDVDLFDVSPVTYPAYESTSVSLAADPVLSKAARAELDLARRRIRLLEAL